MQIFLCPILVSSNADVTNVIFLQVDDTEVVNFLLQTEIIPLCLRIMETGSELSKTVATFIVQKMLLDEMGLTYVCATAERFYAVSTLIDMGAITLLPILIYKLKISIEV
jgi:Cell differentiation family, Rcd1-like